MRYVSLSWGASALCIGLGLFVSSRAEALTIVSNFVPPGYELDGVGIAGYPPSTNLRTGSLQDIFRAAARKWEDLISDNFTITINYGWFPTPGSVNAFYQGLTAGGNPSRALTGSVAFNNAKLNYYFDPTPVESSEFGTMSTSQIDLGGGPIEIRREYSPIDADVFGKVDLLSTAMHEIGHALGLVGWSFYENETADGDIDILIPGFQGTTIPVSSKSHIDFDGPLMSEQGRPVGHRREISQVDLLAVCQLSRFVHCGLIPGDYDRNGTVQIDDFALWRQLFGSAVALEADGNRDGIVNAADYTVWRDHFQSQGIPRGSTSGFQPLPEPSSPVASLLAALLWTSAARAFGFRTPRRGRIAFD